MKHRLEMYKKTFLLFTMLLSSIAVLSQSIDPKFQAVFINGVARKVTWSSSKPTFTILVVGNDKSLVGELEKLASAKQINGKSVSVSTVEVISGKLDQDIVFVSKKGKEQIENVLSAVSTHTMVMSAYDGALDKGSHLNFFLKGNKISFNLNKTEIEKTNLRVTDELVKLASSTK
ncbi:MAG: YfiR family protein [Bacteroidota bacterium]